MGERRVVVDETTGHHEVTSDPVGVVLAERLELAARDLVELVRGDRLGDLRIVVAGTGLVALLTARARAATVGRAALERLPLAVPGTAVGRALTIRGSAGVRTLLAIGGLAAVGTTLTVRRLAVTIERLPLTVSGLPAIRTTLTVRRLAVTIERLPLTIRRLPAIRTTLTVRRLAVTIERLPLT
ncbi:hypothetical protein, partial [Pseudolysinimonas sp.]